MKNLIKFVLGISTILFFVLCLSPKSIQSEVIKTFQQSELSNEEFDVEEFFEGTLENEGTSDYVEEVEVETKKVQKYHSPEVVSYFNEIALGSEFGDGRETAYKWTKNVKIFVEGKKPYYLMEELDRVVYELNSIINTINIEVVSDRSEANLFLFLGSNLRFLSVHPDVDKSIVSNCLGYCVTYSNSAITFVDLDRTVGETEFQKHILREEITQSLGLFNDSEKYENSIFYDGYSTVTEYSEIDKEIIDMLYNE
jgi:hypothetical protein